MMISLIFFPFILMCTLAITIDSDLSKGKFDYIAPTSPKDLIKEDRTFWNNDAEHHLLKNLQINKKSVVPRAKNVVIMVGDGMGISTITATRIYKGQRQFGKSGEDHKLSYDQFPNVGLVKTYNVDMQVPDSAGTATALFSGIKTNYEVLGLDSKSNKSTFDKDVFEKSKVESIMDWAQKSGKNTGIITTTRITHATPAATYAHVNHRDWECDSKIPQEAKSKDFKDIARQLVEDLPGKSFKVIMGGGYQQMGHISKNETSECMRTDNLNLSESWLHNHKNQKNKIFATTSQQLNQVNDETEYVLGLFAPDHLPYTSLRNKGPDGTPRLLDMTKKGLQVLKNKNPNGFVLMVEGGRIDHGHHKNYARLALEESAEFDETVSWVQENTGDDTLIIVTADHSHAMTLNGYGRRGNDILGYGIEDGESKKPALTITYANGPGFPYHYRPSDNGSVLGPWVDVRSDPNFMVNPKYQHLAAFHQKDESHGGEDVAVFAKGPCSDLIRGVMEQNYIPHVISYASCIGPRAELNPSCLGDLDNDFLIKNSSDFVNNKSTLLFALLIIIYYLL